MKLTGLKTLLIALLLCASAAAKADITLAWNPSTGATVTNYTVLWGTNSGNYVFNLAVGTQTTATITGLQANTIYYLAVMATAFDGTQSSVSAEVVCTNGASSTIPTPPIPGQDNGTNSNGVVNGGNGGGGNGGSSGSSGGSSGNSTPSSGVTIVGIPPALNLGFTNGLPLLAIAGTVGADISIQSSTNPSIPSTWTTLTNMTLATPLAGADSNSTAINTAYVPSSQNYQVVDAPPPTGEYFRVVMPYDYMVLADAVLSGDGYPCRLLLVRMPGVMADDVCFVTNQNSFISYTSSNNTFSLLPSGSTIRQIATSLSGSMGHNWTSASEFAYSNGVSTILATVVATEPASSDPVAGQAPPASIQIDF